VFHRSTATAQHEIGVSDYECAEVDPVWLLASSQRSPVADLRSDPDNVSRSSELRL
jgi:hypothetical protein